MKQIRLFAVLVMAVWLAACGENESNKLEQTISFEALPPHNLSEGSFELQASATSGLPVTFRSSNPLTASVNGRTVTLRKAGSLNITASQQGNDSWYEAPDVVRPLIVGEDNNPGKKDQTITFNLNDTEWKSSYGALTLEATASSGLPVTFTSSNPEIATIDGNILQLQDGRYVDFSIMLTATQSGNSEYNAAPPVSKVISVEHDTH
ncbi:MAG: hypothetical protein LBE71_01670 [Dysgonamonadaceae bacterium]|jgi:uncharacterized protein YjdB|nr:hypothetical protein [Dysgonamonadaceae bacterium]